MVQEKETALSGYGLLASKLSSIEGDASVPGLTLPPLYRRFETLNHRLFLHLQDEIAELEEDLRRIDEAEADAQRMLSLCGSSECMPASRRATARPPHGLEWRRIDVLGRIFTKLGHYSESFGR